MASNELQTTLDEILQDKNTNLKPENLKQGVSCLGVEGTLSKGTDTSDATATVNDILEGKTAYGPSGKMTGTIMNNASYSPIFADTNVNVSTKQVQKSLEDPTMIDVLEFSNQNLNKSGQKCLYTSVELNAEFADVANVIGLTAEKLVKGNTILGVEGTATQGVDTSDATATGGQILSGYTAYARGQKIIGTMQSGDVLNGLRGVYQRVDVDSWNNTAYVNTSGAPQIVVISDNLWERNLGHVVVAYGDGAQNWQVTFEANRVKLYWPETWGWKNCLICVFYK